MQFTPDLSHVGDIEHGIVVQFASVVTVPVRRGRELYSADLYIGVGAFAGLTRTQADLLTAQVTRFVVGALAGAVKARDDART